MKPSRSEKMKRGSEFDKYLGYFNSKSTMKFIGIALLVLCVVLFYFGRSYITYLLMCASMVAGLVITLISTLGKASESDIDAYITSKTADLEYKATNEKAFLQKLQKHMEPAVGGAFEIVPGSPIKRGKDGLIRTTSYVKHIIYPLDSGIAVAYRRVSLLGDETVSEQLEIAFDKLKEFRVESEPITVSYGQSTVAASRDLLVIVGEGMEPVKLPIHSDASTDELVARILRFKELATKQAE